jgi:lipoprotein NlpD
MHLFTAVRLRVFIILNVLMLITACTLNYPVHIQKDSFVLRGIDEQRLLPLPDYHTISVGDTLYSIAFRYGTTVEKLANNNHLSFPYVIKVGDKLFLKSSAPKPLPTKSNKTIVENSSNKLVKPEVVKTPVTTQAATNLKTPVKPNTPVRKVIKAPVSQVKETAMKISAPTQWRWPAKGRLLVGFGGNNGLNQGIDIAGNIGESIVAARDGVVVYAGSGLRGYGKLLIVKHDEVYLSAYAHNHRLLVQEGATVKAGQKIAEMGSSDTDRPKLHFEIRQNGTPIDPKRFLP